MNTSKRIAIVDDNADIRYMVSEICLTQNWEPLPCADHLEVRALLNGGGRIDLFVVDYHLPEVDGIAIVRMIRAILPRVPIVVLTVEEKESVMGRFMEAGANDYALKPIKALDLLARIRAHLSYGEQARQAFNDQKNVSPVVLRAVVFYLKQQDGFVDIQQVAAGAQISHTSAYRYLRHMQAQGMIETRYDHGVKLGRPKAHYRLKHPTG